MTFLQTLFLSIVSCGVWNAGFTPNNIIVAALPLPLPLPLPPQPYPPSFVPSTTTSSSSVLSSPALSNLLSNSSTLLSSLLPPSSTPPFSYPKNTSTPISSSTLLPSSSLSSSNARSVRSWNTHASLPLDIPSTSSTSSSSSSSIQLKTTTSNITTISTSMSLTSFLHTLWHGCTLIVVSELGDKTFFFTSSMSMALPNQRFTLFVASWFALSFMTFMASWLSQLCTLYYFKFISPSFLYFISFVLFMYMAWQGPGEVEQYTSLSSSNASIPNHEQSRSSRVLKNKDETHFKNETRNFITTTMNKKDTKQKKDGEEKEEEQEAMNQAKKSMGLIHPLKETKDVDEPTKENDKYDALVSPFFVESKEKKGSSSLKIAKNEHTKERDSEETKKKAHTLVKQWKGPWTWFWLTCLAELGDRSQWMTFILTASSLHPWTLLLGMCLGHGLCTALAVIGGHWVSSYLPWSWMKRCMQLCFFMFGCASFINFWTYHPQASSSGTV